MKPLPPLPARSLDEVALILDTYSGGPVVPEAGKDAVAHARRLRQIASRYRARLIQELMDRHGWDWETAVRAVDLQVLR